MEIVMFDLTKKTGAVGAFYTQWVNYAIRVAFKKLNPAVLIEDNTPPV